MAESKNNIITHGLSGKVGDQIVFSSRFGRTFLGIKPKERTGEPNEVQKAQQDKFQQAVIYAKGVGANPETKEAYKAVAKPQEGITFYNVAVADFLKAPDIKSIDLSKYSGKAGDVIKVTVTDEYKVQEVSVTILNADGTEVEDGMAAHNAEMTEWIYTATAENVSLDGDKIVVKATDTPGNISLKEETVK